MKKGMFLYLFFRIYSYPYNLFGGWNVTFDRSRELSQVRETFLLFFIKLIKYLSNHEEPRNKLKLKFRNYFKLIYILIFKVTI